MNLPGGSSLHTTPLLALAGMCVEHKIVAVGCGHLCHSYRQYCSAAPSDYPEMTCEKSRVTMTLDPLSCDHCLDTRSRTGGFGRAYSSLCSKRALNVYWRDLAELNGCCAAEPLKPRDGDEPPGGLDRAAYSHWKKTMKLFLTEARPRQVAVGGEGGKSWRRIDLAAGSCGQDLVAAIACEAIEGALRLTPDFEETLADTRVQETEGQPEMTLEKSCEEIHEEMMKLMQHDADAWT